MNEFVQKQTAPNAIASLVLGILSLVSGCFTVGLIFGIIGLALSSSGMKEYYTNPDMYTNFGMLKTGKILSLLGVIFSGVTLLISIIYMIVAGGSFLALFNLLNR